MMMTTEQKQVYAHYIKLYAYYLSEDIHDEGRKWLATEIAEIEESAGMRS